MQKEALYPSRKESLALLTGNFRFVAYNSEFAILLGVLYWLLGLIAISFPWDVSYLAPIILFVGFWSYTKKQEGGGAKVFFVSVGNALLHSLAVIFIALFFAHANGIYLGQAWPRFSFLLFAAEMIVVGGVIAAALFGGYLYASSRWWNLNHNDAFSSMRLDSHRNFLRIRIKDDEITIYPIGLDRVPRRHEWRFNTERAGTPPPVYVPVSPLTPHLIESPIAVRSWEGSQGPHAAASA